MFLTSHFSQNGEGKTRLVCVEEIWKDILWISKDGQVLLNGWTRNRCFFFFLYICEVKYLRMNSSKTNLHFYFSLSCIGEWDGNPLQCSCLENPRDGGAWWASVYGVAQSQTRLGRLSSSSSSRVFNPHHVLCYSPWGHRSQSDLLTKPCQSIALWRKHSFCFKREDPSTKDKILPID